MAKLEGFAIRLIETDVDHEIDEGWIRLLFINIHVDKPRFFGGFTFDLISIAKNKEHNYFRFVILDYGQTSGGLFIFSSCYYKLWVSIFGIDLIKIKGEG